METVEHKYDPLISSTFMPLLNVINVDTMKVSSDAYRLTYAKPGGSPIGRLEGKLPDDLNHTYEKLRYLYDEKDDNKVGALHINGGSRGFARISVDDYFSTFNTISRSTLEGSPEDDVGHIYV